MTLLTDCHSPVLSHITNSFWRRALLTDWCGPVQSCQPLFLVESIAYRLVQSCAVLSTSLSGGEHCLPIGAVLCSLVNLSFWWRALLTDWCGPVQSCQHLFLVESIAYRLVRSCAVLSTSLSGGEHCLPIGAVLCSLVNISFWWRALLTDWCGPVQSCQHLFLVESIAYRLGAVLCSLAQDRTNLVESIAYRLVQSCAVLSTSLSGGEHCSPPEREVDSLVTGPHQSGKQCSPPEREVDKTA